MTKRFTQEGCFTFPKFYSRMVDQCPDGGTMVEVGVWTGHSLLYLMDCIAKTGKRINVFAIDLFADDVYGNGGPIDGSQWTQFQARMHPHWRDINVIKMDSARAADLFRPESVDFCFIDAGHRYEAVKADLAAWWTKIKPSGILAGHDLKHPPVERAVNEADDDWPVTIFRDPAENVFAITRK